MLSRNTALPYGLPKIIIESGMIIVKSRYSWKVHAVITGHQMANRRKNLSLGGFSLYGGLGSSTSVKKDDDLLIEESSEHLADHTPPKKSKLDENEEKTETKSVGAVSSSTVISVCACRKGEREDMQDAHVLNDHYGITGTDINRSAFYAIFDGHAGRNAADFAAKYLPSKLKQKLAHCTDMITLEKFMKKNFVDTYKFIDEQFLIEARKLKPSWKDGTTATTIVIINDFVYCANIGDSKAVVCRCKSSDNLVALQLTVDHSPMQFDERMRIQKMGGNVKGGRVMGILEVSRSIGDGQFKVYGLISTPDVKKFSVTAEDRFIIIACDGLWKAFSNQEAVEFVYKKHTEVLESVVEPKEGERYEEPRIVRWEKVANELAAEAVKRKCGDNVSVIIIVFNPED